MLTRYRTLVTRLLRHSNAKIGAKVLSDPSFTSKPAAFDKMKCKLPLSSLLSFILFAYFCYCHSIRTTSQKYIYSVDDLTFSSPAHTDKSDTLSISFQIPEKKLAVRLNLQRDAEIYDQPVTVHHVRSDGTKDVEHVAAGAHLAYHGTVESELSTPADWTRITVHEKHGTPLLEGVMTIGGQIFTIQTDYNYRSSRRSEDPGLPENKTPYIILFTEAEDAKNGPMARRSSDTATCSIVDPTLFSNNPPLFESLDGSILPRQSGGGRGRFDPRQFIGSTQGCPRQRLIALMGIAVDCNYAAQFQSPDDIRQHIITQINSASRTYEQTFNISLRVRNITISERACPSGGPVNTWNQPCTRGGTIAERLDSFATWKRSFQDDTAVWTMLTTCTSGTTVGVAFLATTCHQSMTSGNRFAPSASVNVVARTTAEWQVIAHEIGHNFGASHDCLNDCGESSCCPLSAEICNARGRFLMNPAVGNGINSFSPCSIGTICTMMGQRLIQTQCMENNENVPVASTKQCGNGIVDPGEDCDCGSEEQCADNRCCDPATCRFRPGAACDTSAGGCCNESCQLSPQGTVCRESTGLCDPEETCTGDSGVCPRDRLLRDGDSCGLTGGNTTCASGQCTSRALQCASLLGLESNSSVAVCNSNQCQMSCRELGGGDEACRTTNQAFVDGTPCDDGLCYAGECRKSTNSVPGWIDRNRSLFIGLCVVGGILVFVALFACCVCCRRGKPVKEAMPMPSPPMTPVEQRRRFSNLPLRSTPSMQQQQQQRYSGQSHDWSPVMHQRSSGGISPSSPMQDRRYSRPQSSLPRYE
ncbi:hypothetical protein VHEMI03371 [[Torrubiella] hemipterigena]|uniref:Disintegrin and metalloproteinase domain-containing protein B n=1 Tax=[Torrubiella] hemipterigena TaxID=1531966 RepID=A0A0A1SSD4_9HYPO|nr:hypothetical protein VHEMI03371 [[Torrubiella] hemipterigena]